MADPNVLLVEGKDDQHVFWSLLEHHQVPETFEVIDMGGIDNLLRELPVRLKGSDLQHLGAVVDADENLSDRWHSLHDLLTNIGYDCPQQPADVGTIIEQSGRPKVGIWIMPDNRAENGMLEDFVGFLVPDADNLWSMADQCLNKIPEPERRFRPQHLCKAHIHTWLAWQEEPGTPMGQAITKRYLDPNVPHAQQLVAWIRRLFEV